jgi:hypothetical protein
MAYGCIQKIAGYPALVEYGAAQVYYYASNLGPFEYGQNVNFTPNVQTLNVNGAAVNTYWATDIVWDGSYSAGYPESWVP